jgi:hypothetical protein
MQLFAMLPPMPLGARLVLGLLGTLFAGILNLVFRKAAPKWWQFGLAFLLCPGVILLISEIGENSGQRTPFVFFGALVGIVCIRGRGRPEGIPSFALRAGIVFVTFVALGPVIGLGSYFLRYQARVVRWEDSWERGLSLEDGFDAGFAGAILALTMIISAIPWRGRTSDTALPQSDVQGPFPSKDSVAAEK